MIFKPTKTYLSKKKKNNNCKLFSLLPSYFLPSFLLPSYLLPSFLLLSSSQILLIFFILSTTATTATTAAVSNIQQQIYSNFKKYALSCISDSPLKIINTKSMTFCSVSCLSQGGSCLRFEFTPLINECRLYSTWRSVLNLVSRPSCVCYIRKDLCPFAFDYIPAIQTCLQVYTALTSTYAANAECQRKANSGHLVNLKDTITSRAISAYISSQIYYRFANVCPYYTFWSCGQRPANSNNFAWMLNSSYTIPLSNDTYWASGSPKLALDQEAAIALDNSVGLWRDYTYTVAWCSICEALAFRNY